VLTNIVPFPCSVALFALNGISNIILFLPALSSVTAVVVADAVQVKLPVEFIFPFSMLLTTNDISLGLVAS
tara:strand:- start:1735 stop:1947 length:213 start_codon:yes stop_codon:yes gene_type:complete